MTTEEALEFLRQYQPLPDDEDLSEELITQYDGIREFFIAYPDSRCIPLFLNSFGEGMGLGVYQLVDEVFYNFSSEQVVPYLKESILSDKGWIAFWSLHIAGLYDDAIELIPIIKKRLVDSNEDLKGMALSALIKKPEAEVKPILLEFLEKEKDPSFREQAQKILKNYQ